MIDRRVAVITFFVLLRALDAAHLGAQCGDCRYTGGSSFSCSSGGSSGKVSNATCAFGPPCGGGECCQICGTGSGRVISFFGDADGGSVDLFIGGFQVSLATFSSQPASNIAQSLAALINHNTNIGATASAQGGNLIINTTSEVYIKILDPGLNSVEPVPTVSEWGLVVIGLLLLIGATVVLGFRRPALAGMSGAPFALRSPLPIFAARLFARCLGAAVTVLALILALVVWLEGSVNATDLTGSSLTAIGVAYLVHLWLLLRREGP